MPVTSGAQVIAEARAKATQCGRFTQRQKYRTHIGEEGLNSRPHQLLHPNRIVPALEAIFVLSLGYLRRTTIDPS